MNRFGGLVAGIAVVAAALLVCSPASAAPKKNNQHDEQRRKLQRQIDEDQQKLNVLNREETQLQKAVPRLEKELPAARDRLKKEEADLKAAEKQLDQIRADIDKKKDAAKALAQQLAATVARIEDAQPTGSPLAQAKAAYVTAKDAYANLNEQILHSDEYKNEYQQAVASPDRTVAMPLVRKKYIDENPKVLEARERMAAAKTAYDPLLDGVLKKSADWTRAAQAADKAKDEQQDAEKDLRAAVTKMAPLKRSVAGLQVEVKRLDGQLDHDRKELKQIPGRKDKLKKDIDNAKRELSRLH